MTEALRAETGPMQFPDDWTGVFIRGDNAAFYAGSLRAVLKLLPANDAFNYINIISPLEGLASDLESCNHNKGDRPTPQMVHLAALATPSPPPDEGVPTDVAELVIAARIVAFEDQSPEALRALDKASEAFASRVPWDEEPEPTLDELADAITEIKTDEPVQKLHELPDITHEMVSAATKEVAWALEIDNTIGLRATVKAGLKAALKARPVPPDVSGVVERLQTLATEALGTAETNRNVEFVEPAAFWQDIARLLNEAAAAILSLASEREGLETALLKGMDGDLQQCMANFRAIRRSVQDARRARSST